MAHGPEEDRDRSKPSGEREEPETPPLAPKVESVGRRPGPRGTPVEGEPRAPEAQPSASIGAESPPRKFPRVLEGERGLGRASTWFPPRHGAAAAGQEPAPARRREWGGSGATRQLWDRGQGAAGHALELVAGGLRTTRSVLEGLAERLRRRGDDARAPEPRGAGTRRSGAPARVPAGGSERPFPMGEAHVPDPQGAAHEPFEPERRDEASPNPDRGPARE